MQKYRCYGKDDLGYPYDALSMADEHGDWYLASDVDAELTSKRDALDAAVAGIAQRDARIAELENRLELWGTTTDGQRVQLDFGADGIACRDETIRLLDGVRDRLTRRIAELKQLLDAAEAIRIGQERPNKSE